MHELCSHMFECVVILSAGYHYLFFLSLIMIVWLFIAALLLALTWLHLYRSRGLPPGPLGVPILGYLPWLTGNQPHLKFTALAAKYGEIYSVRMGNVFTVVLSDPRLIRQAFASDDYSGRAPLFLTHGIMKDNGIICVQGDKWRKTRKFISSSLRTLGMVKFGPGRTKMEADILEGIQELVSKIRAKAQPVDPEPVLIHVLGNLLFKLVFGKVWSEDDVTWKTLQHLQEEGTKLIGVSAAINFLPFLRFLPAYKDNIKFIQEGITFTHGIYQDLLSKFQDVYGSEISQDDRPLHLMAAFVKEMRREGSQENFSKTQFNYLMADIFGAGVDTTLATLRWFLLFMALNPEWQDRVHKELDSVTDGRCLILDHINRTPILEACLWETQRIRSVTPLGIPHGTLKETQLGGYRIPAGTMVVPLQWAIHMNPKTYHQPDVFLPSRFLSSDGQLSKSDNFMPFQVGKRMCVGEEYARALLFLFGGTLLKEFRLSVPEVVNLDGEPGITLNPPRHLIRFTPRHHN